MLIVFSETNLWSSLSSNIFHRHAASFMQSFLSFSLVFYQYFQKALLSLSVFSIVTLQAVFSVDTSIWHPGTKTNYWFGIVFFIFTTIVTAIQKGYICKCRVNLFKLIRCWCYFNDVYLNCTSSIYQTINQIKIDCIASWNKCL